MNFAYNKVGREGLVDWKCNDDAAADTVIDNGDWNANVVTESLYIIILTR